MSRRSNTRSRFVVTLLAQTKSFTPLDRRNCSKSICSSRISRRGWYCDVTDDASVKALVSTVLSQTGRIDVLVNNAGLGLFGGAEESSINQVEGLFDVNVFGTVRVTNAVLPSMRQRGEGRIINISSILGLIPAPYSAYYSATKHALEGYSELLDHEVRAFNIRVSLIEPAYTRSVFDQNALEPDAKLKEYDQARAGTHALLQDVMPKADPPELVADVVAPGRDRPPPSAALYRRQDRSADQPASSVRPCGDVRQEPAQRAAASGLKRPSKSCLWQLLAQSGTLVPT